MTEKNDHPKIAVSKNEHFEGSSPSHPRSKVENPAYVQIEKVVEIGYNWIAVGLVPTMPAVRYSRAAFLEGVLWILRLILMLM